MKNRFHLPLLCSLLLAGLVSLSDAQVAVQGAPQRIDYQGKVLDSAGNPLAATTPTTYTVVFRIYAAQSGGSPLWSEQQAVTVSNGLFSVRLGEGVAYSTEPNPALNTVFTSTDRYMGMTIVIPPATLGNSVEITPRLAFLASPFAFVATRAGVADSVSQFTGTSALKNTTINGTLGGSITSSATITGGTIDTGNFKSGTFNNGTFNDGTFKNGTFTDGTFNNGTFAGNGAGLANLNATNIGSGTLAAARLPANVAFKDADAAFTGITSFSKSVTMNAGAANTGASLELGTTDLKGIRFSNPNNVIRWDMYITNNTGNLSFTCSALGTTCFLSLNSGQIQSSSDVRLKKDITPLTGVLNRVLKLRPVSYRFKKTAESTPKSIGLIAQEVQPLFPEMVDQSGEYLALGYGELGPVAIGAIQEQHQQILEQDSQKQAQIEKLKEENGSLRRQMDTLAKRLDALEARPVR